MRASGIYAIVSPSGKCYIGSANDFHVRWTEHKRQLRKGIHHNYLLQRASDKYGLDNMEFKVIELCEKENLFTREQWHMDAMQPQYNISMCAFTPSRDPKIAKMIGDAHRGKKQSPEYIEKRIAPLRGRKMSEESNEKRRRAMTGRKHSAERIEKNRRSRKLSGPEHPNYGKTCPDHTKAAISKAVKGVPVPEERRRKTSETMQGMNGGGDNPRARKILCIETGVIFGCFRDAIKWLREEMDIRAYNLPIRNVCLGKRESAFGYKWKYVDD